jgi:hypothetical protein
LTQKWESNTGTLSMFRCLGVYCRNRRGVEPK